MEEAYAWLSGYSYRKQITVQTAYLDSNLTAFPLYVKISGDTAIGAHMQDTTNYYDIRFTDTSDNVLPYECESMSISAGVATGYYWVKTNLSTSTGATLYCYYGKSGAIDGQDAANVWDTNFKGVWHLKETVTDEATGGIHYDSTSNANNGTQYYNDDASGKIYNAQRFDGVGDKVSFTSIEQTQITFSAFVYSNTKGNSNYPRIFNMPGYFLYFYREPATDYVDFASSHSTTSGYWRSPIGSIGDGQWYHIAIVYDGSSVNNDPLIFINGTSQVAELTAPVGTLVSNAGTGYIGDRADGLRSWDGTIDEVRVSNVVRSAAWLKFEYYNVNEADNELSWGGEVAAANAIFFGTNF